MQLAKPLLLFKTKYDPKVKHLVARFDIERGLATNFSTAQPPVSYLAFSVSRCGRRTRGVKDFLFAGSHNLIDNQDYPAACSPQS
jgi:hypothetical protein